MSIRSEYKPERYDYLARNADNSSLTSERQELADKCFFDYTGVAWMDKRDQKPPPKEMTIEAVAKRHGVDYDWLRRRCAFEGWVQAREELSRQETKTRIESAQYRIDERSIDISEDILKAASRCYQLHASIDRKIKKAMKGESDETKADLMEWSELANKNMDTVKKLSDVVRNLRKKEGGGTTQNNFFVPVNPAAIGPIKGNVVDV